MSKSRVVVAFVAIALVVPFVVAGQNKGRPPMKPPATAAVVMEGKVQSDGLPITISRDVASYGPMNQALYIHGTLLPPAGSTGFQTAVEELRALGPDTDGYYGPYYGQIRVLDDRLDYFFDTTEGCVQDNTAANLCPFRLTVADGAAIYTGKGETRTVVRIAFDEGRYLLYHPCDPALDPINCYVKLLGCYDGRDCPGVPSGGEGYIYATLNVLFQQ